MVFSKDNISPGGNGRTSVNLPDKLASDRTYFWRARAQDGANTGPFSSAVKFSVVTPIQIGAPPLESPLNGATVDHNPPHMLFGNAPVTGPAGPLLVPGSGRDRSGVHADRVQRVGRPHMEPDAGDTLDGFAPDVDDVLLARAGIGWQ